MTGARKIPLKLYPSECKIRKTELEGTGAGETAELIRDNISLQNRGLGEGNVIP